MYRKHAYRCLAKEEIVFLLQMAHACIPAQINGSFMVPFAHAPTGFEQCTITKLQLVGLLPSQQIAAHRDSAIAPAIRYHIPLQVNPGCWVYHSESWLRLRVGAVYQMDPTQPHGAVNWGSEIRLHLMIDVIEG